MRYISFQYTYVGRSFTSFPLDEFLVSLDETCRKVKIKAKKFAKKRKSMYIQTHICMYMYNIMQKKKREYIHFSFLIYSIILSFYFILASLKAYSKAQMLYNSSFHVYI